MTPPTPASSPPRPFVIHTAAGLAKLPPLQSLVKGLLYLNSLALLIGPPGSFKSFMALWFAECIAFAQNFGDQKVTGGGVLYIIGEGTPGFAKREAAWRLAHQRPEQSDRLWFAELRGSLFDPLTLKQLRDDVEAMGQTFHLVVVDTLAACFHGADENSTRDMSLMCAYLRQLQQLPGSPCVLVCHHTPRSAPDRERGSTALRGAADTVLVLQRKGGTTVELSMPKQKDSIEAEPTYFTLQTVHLGIDDDGDPITSGVLVPSTAPVVNFNREASPFCDAVVEMLTKSDTPLRRGELWTALESRQLGGQRQFDRALADLQERQLITKGAGHTGAFSLTSRDEDVAA